MQKFIGILSVILLAARPGLRSEPQQVTSLPPPETNKIIFECETGADFPAILAKSENKAPVVFLSWIPEYFPQTELAVQECQKAAERLQNKQEANGNLDSFQLSIGKVNDISGVCLIQKQERCAEENLIFSLENIENPEKVLEKMLNRKLLSVRGDFRIRTIPFRWLPF